MKVTNLVLLLTIIGSGPLYVILGGPKYNNRNNTLLSMCLRCTETWIKYCVFSTYYIGVQCIKNYPLGDNRIKTC